MQIDTIENVKHVTLFPGEYYSSNRNVIIKTLLGSCISACLYDPIQKVIGMNHFLLSNKRYSKTMSYTTTEAGKYGVHSMELVINNMLKLGANRRNLKAKAYGGSTTLKNSTNNNNFFCIGEVNIRFIREFLKAEKIPLLFSDLGENYSRRINFSFADFNVDLKKTELINAKDIAKQDKLFWEKSIHDHEKSKTKIDLWK